MDVEDEGHLWMPFHGDGGIDVQLLSRQDEDCDLNEILSTELICYRIPLGLQMEDQKRRCLSAGWYSSSNNSVPSWRRGLTRFRTSSRRFSFAETATDVSSGVFSKGLPTNL